LYAIAGSPASPPAEEEEEEEVDFLEVDFPSVWGFEERWEIR